MPRADKPRMHVLDAWSVTLEVAVGLSDDDALALSARVRSRLIDWALNLERDPGLSGRPLRLLVE